MRTLVDELYLGVLLQISEVLDEFLELPHRLLLSGVVLLLPDAPVLVPHILGSPVHLLGHQGPLGPVLLHQVLQLIHLLLGPLAALVLGAELSFEEFIAADQGSVGQDAADLSPEVQVPGDLLVVLAHGFDDVIVVEVLDADLLAEALDQEPLLQWVELALAGVGQLLVPLSPGLDHHIVLPLLLLGLFALDLVREPNRSGIAAIFYIYFGLF